MKNILCIGDLHSPFIHPDALKFVCAVCDKFMPNPDLVVFMGDEIDGHAFSYHEKSVKAMGANQELENAIGALEPWYSAFPKAKILESNHGSLVYRKANTVQIPSMALKEYREILEAPQGWDWVEFHEEENKDGRSIYFHHGLRANGFNLADAEGKHIVQGHFHTHFEITYKFRQSSPLWAMQVGCLVDQRTYAFEYAKNIRPNYRLGVGMIRDGRPFLVPMILKGSGKWNGKII